MRYYKIIFVVACFLAMPIVFSETASASGLSQTQPNDGGSFAVGGIGGDFNSRTSVSRIYVPGTGSGSFTFYTPNWWNFTQLDVHTVDSSSRCQLGTANRVATVSGTSTFLGTGGSSTLASRGVTGISGATLRQGGYRVYCIVTTSNSSNVLRFYLTAGANQLIGNDVSVNSGTTGFIGTRTDPRTTDPNWSKVLEFAPNCEVGRNTINNTWPGASRNIVFYDLDLQSTFQSKPLTATVAQTTTYPTSRSYSGNAPGSPQNYNLGVENDTKTMPVTFNVGGPRRYRLTLSPIAGVNAIKIALPYDQIYTLIDCPAADPPTCSISNTIRPGGFTLNWSSTNATSASLSGVGSVGTSGPRNVGATNTTYTLTVSGPGGTATCRTTTVVPPNPSCSLNVVNGATTLRWSTTNATRMSINGNNATPVSGGDLPINPQFGTTNYSGVATNSIGATANCSDSITISTPTCSSVEILRIGGVVTEVPAGEQFATRVNLRNNNPFEIAVNSANYAIVSPPSGSSRTSASSTNSNNMSANSNQSYRSNNTEDIILYGPGTFTVNWTINTVHGSINCSGQVISTILPLVCNVANSSNSIGIPFPLTITLTNPNSIPVRIDRSEWTATNTTPATGFGFENASGGSLNATGGGTTILGPGSITINSDNVTSTASGDWSVSWTIVTQYSGANPTTGCSRNDANTARANPYTRFYGNDVFAGGGFGSSCSIVPADVKGNGVFRNNTQNHANYIGAAAELAIFATGQIDNVLPGSQVAGRTPLQALSFSNENPLGSGTLPLGGQFAATLCADDFLSLDTTGFGNVSANRLQINNSDGDYAETSANSEVVVINGDNINNNKRIQLFVNGDIVISNNIVYTNNGSWGSIDEIPLIRMYATGDIFIDRSVTEISGLFVAGGTIYTCTNGSSLWGSNQLTANCNSKLTLYGAFIADNVELLRVNGSYGLTGPVPEGAGSPNIAESFIFSPELYLALLSEGDANSSIKFDSILSLPPAF